MLNSFTNYANKIQPKKAMKKRLGFVFLLVYPMLAIKAVYGQQPDSLSAPQDSLRVLHTFSEQVTDFEVDNLGYIYLLNKQQQLKKITPNFDSMAVFNDLRHFGKLHTMDVSNPLKVLLFYKDFGTIIILDRLLNVKNVLNLRTTAGIVQATAITQSYDNNIWVYDALDNAIKKIDESGRVLITSPDFRVVFDNPPQPESLHDFNRFLYAYDPTIGMLVMDYFGAYKNKVSLLGWKNLHGIAKGIVGTDEKGLVYYRPASLTIPSQELPLSIVKSKKIRIDKQKLYTLNPKNELRIYQIREMN